jgi:hypothetical protein
MSMDDKTMETLPEAALDAIAGASGSAIDPDGRAG